MVYRSGQFEVIYPYLEGVTPECLILGGPADGDEAQCAERKWPGIFVVGSEPNLEMYEYQEPIWPRNGVLYRAALSSDYGMVEIKVGDDPRGTSLDLNRSGCIQRTVSITVDSIIRNNALQNIVLWLDIEGWEYRALLGAEKSISQGKILLVNVEVMDRSPEEGEKIDRFMGDHGFEEVHRWSSDREFHPHWDKLFLPINRTWYRG